MKNHCFYIKNNTEELFHGDETNRYMAGLYYGNYRINILKFNRLYIQSATTKAHCKTIKVRK